LKLNAGHAAWRSDEFEAKLARLLANPASLMHWRAPGSATAKEAEQVRSREFSAYLGSNCTCEIGLNLATGKDYESFIFMLEELSRPPQPGRA
jgi:D-lactate dehydrogenase